MGKRKHNFSKSDDDDELSLADAHDVEHTSLLAAIMIPLSRRTARSTAEKTLLSCSRQALSRPARVLYYSTPSKPVNSPPDLSAPSPSMPELYPAYMHTPSASAPSEPILDDMKTFLRKPPAYTVLHPPLPEDVAKNESHEEAFMDTNTADLLAVMQACLHNVHDVRRAREIFERLRQEKPGDPALSARLYDHFLQSYMEIGYTKESSKKEVWVDDFWSLFTVMEKGTEKVNTTPSSYALALLAWHR